MKTPLENYNIWLEIKHSEAPDKIRELAENILNLNWKIKRIDDEDVKSIFEAQEILGVVLSNFTSIFQHSAELQNKEKEEPTKKVQNDLINMQREINTTVNNLVLRPQDKLYPSIFFQIKQLIAEPINSLIGLVVMDSWENSRKVIRRWVKTGFPSRLEKKEFISCNEEKFYKTFYDETLKRAGQHPMFTVFKAPVKTIASPFLSSADKREMVLGLYEEMKNSEKKNEEIKLPEAFTTNQNPTKDETILSDDEYDSEDSEES